MKGTAKRLIFFSITVLAFVLSVIFNYFIEKEPIISIFLLLLGGIGFIITFFMKKAKGDVLKNKLLWGFASLISIIMLYGVYTERYFEGIHDISYFILITTIFLNFYAFAIIFAKNPKSSKYKYIVLILFEYQFILGTLMVESPWIMYIPLPLFVVYLLYKDIKILSIASTGVFIFNIVAVWNFIKKIDVMKDPSYRSYSYIVQFLLFFLFTLALCVTLRINNTFKRERLLEIEDINSTSEKLSKKIISIAKKSRDNALITNVIIEELENATKNSLEILHSITNGNDLKIECIENQTEMTANISNMIDEVVKESDIAVKLSGYSLDGLKRGKIAFEKLKDKSNIIVKKNEQVIEIINNFVHNAKQVKSITQGIAEISEQTDLLSLNASIESARASSAAKDFGIVASEIRGLAENTSNLTDSIDKIVQLLENNALKAQRVVNNVVESINKENITIDDTLKEIIIMEDSIYKLGDNVNLVLNKIVDMSNFNIEIVNNITKLMATSQEVTAYMEQSIELNNENISKVIQTRKLMNELLEISNQVEYAK